MNIKRLFLAVAIILPTNLFVGAVGVGIGYAFDSISLARALHDLFQIFAMAAVLGFLYRDKLAPYWPTYRDALRRLLARADRALAPPPEPGA